MHSVTILISGIVTLKGHSIPGGHQTYSSLCHRTENSSMWTQDFQNLVSQALLIEIKISDSKENLLRNTSRK